MSSSEHDQSVRTSPQSASEQLGGVLSRIRAIAPSLPDSERIVAAYIEHNPVEAIQSPIAELAATIGVSTTTIIRTARSLGYSGLRELKYSLAVDVVDFAPELDDAVSGENQAIDIAKSVIHANMSALSDTLTVLDNAMLEAAVTALLQARRIECFGIGSSGPVASDAYIRFLRIGLPARVTLDPYSQLATAHQLGEQDVAFFVSHTGRTTSIVNAARTARDLGATVILLTSFARSPVAQYADVILMTATRESAAGAEAMTSRISHLCVIDVLYVTCMLRRPQAQHLLREVHEGYEAQRMHDE